LEGWGTTSTGEKVVGVVGGGRGPAVRRKRGREGLKGKKEIYRISWCGLWHMRCVRKLRGETRQREIVVACVYLAEVASSACFF
jgi:hypothetical protein